MLTHNRKNVKSSAKINVGDVVLIGSDNLKRLDWPLARVKQVIRSKDGEIRVVRLTTGSGEIMRPIQRIFPLELDGACNENLKEAVRSKFNKIQKPRLQLSETEQVQDMETIKQNVTRSGRISRKPDRLEYK